MHREFSDLWQIPLNVLHNFLLFYSNFDYLYNHFISGSYLDPLTALFALIGTCVTVYFFGKHSYRNFLLTYIAACVIIGLTSPYPYSPATRGLFFIPFGAIFAGLGLAWVMPKIKKRLLAKIVVVGVFCIVFGLNAYQSQIGVFKQNGYSATSLIIKELQEAKTEQTKPMLVVISDKNPYFGYKLIPVFEEAYGLEKINVATVRSSELSCILLRNKKVLIFQSDIQPINEINRLHCPSTEYSLTVIESTIPL